MLKKSKFGFTYFDFLFAHFSVEDSFHGMRENWKFSSLNKTLTQSCGWCPIIPFYWLTRQWSDNYFAQICNPWQILYENWRSREMWGGLFWTTEMSKTWEDKACPLSGCRTKSFAQDLMDAFPGKIIRWNLLTTFLGLRKNYETVTLGKGSNCRNIPNQWPPRPSCPSPLYI